MSEFIKERNQYSAKVLKCQDHTSLARDLLQTHGLETAVKICQSHHWHGVIKILKTPVFQSEETLVN